MPSNRFIDALKAEGGCGLFMYGLLALVLGGAIYEAVVHRSDGPKIKTIREFANECFNREEEKSGKLLMEMSDNVRAHIDDVCAAEYEDYLARQRQK